MSILADITSEEYHADQLGDEPSLTSSIAKLLITASPAHARAAHPRLNPNYERKTEEKFDVGTAVHAILLEGRDAIEVVPYDDWRTAAAKEAREVARSYGRIPLLAKQATDVYKMLDAVRDQIAALDVDPPLLTDGKPEQTLLWKDHGVNCRARLDWLRDDRAAIDDLKSTGRTADPDAWSRSLFGMGYDIQAAFYLRGLRAVTGIESELRFLVAETSEPYAVSVVSLAPDALAFANSKVEHAIDLWARCLKADRWDGYPRKVAYASAPSYEQVKWLEREALLEEAAA